MHVYIKIFLNISDWMQMLANVNDLHTTHVTLYSKWFGSVMFLFNII